MDQVNNSTTQTVFSFQAPEGAKETNLSSNSRITLVAAGTIAALVGILALSGALSALGTIGGGVFAGVAAASIIGALGIKQVETESETDVNKAIESNVKGFFRGFNKIDSKVKGFFTKYNQMDGGVKEFFSKYNQIESNVNDFFAGQSQPVRDNTQSKDGQETATLMNKLFTEQKEQAAGRVIANACSAYIESARVAVDDENPSNNEFESEIPQDIEIPQDMIIFDDDDMEISDDIEVPQDIIISDDGVENIEQEQVQQESRYPKRKGRTPPTNLSYGPGFEPLNEKKIKS